MAHRRHGAALDEGDAAVRWPPFFEAPTGIRAPAQAGARAAQARARTAYAARSSAPMWLTRMNLATRLGHAHELVEHCLRVSTAVMTYCATTASKKSSGKARFGASITASTSTLASLRFAHARVRLAQHRLRKCRRRTMPVLGANSPSARGRCRRRRRGCGPPMRSAAAIESCRPASNTSPNTRS